MLDARKEQALLDFILEHLRTPVPLNYGSNAAEMGGEVYRTKLLGMVEYKLKQLVPKPEPML